jgi:hypothetical protein
MKVDVYVYGLDESFSPPEVLRQEGDGWASLGDGRRFRFSSKHMAVVDKEADSLASGNRELPRRRLPRPKHQCLCECRLDPLPDTLGQHDSSAPAIQAAH